MFKKAGRVSLRRAFAIMLIAVALVFGSSLNNEFVWDDEEQIVNNMAVHSLRFVPQLFTSSTFNSGGASSLGGLYYKPAMPTVFALIISVGGLNPFWIRLTQVTLHLLNGWMIFLFLIELAIQFKDKTRWSIKMLGWLALALSLLFLLHPLNVETAIYLSSMQDVLFMSFGLAAVLIVLKTAPSVKNILLMAGLLLFSLLSKETGLMIVVWIVLLAQLVRREWRLAIQGIANSIVLLYLFMRFMVAGIGIQAHNLSPITRSSLWERIISIPKIISYYLTNLVWPTRLAISQHWVVTQMSLKEFWLPLGLVLTVVGVCLLVWLKVKNRYGVSSCIYLWMLLSLLLLVLSGGLHLQLVPLDMTVADRWFYLPFLSILLIIFVGGVAFLQTKKKQLWLICLLMGLVVPLGWLSWRRSQEWQSGRILYAADINKNPDAFDLQNNMGVVLYRDGQYQQAKYHFERSIELAPDWWTNWNNLGGVLELEGDLEGAETSYLKAIDHGQYYLAYENYAKILLRQEKHQEAVEFCEATLQLLPNNLTLWQVLILAYQRSGQTEQAHTIAAQLDRANPGLMMTQLLHEENGELNKN